MEIIWNTCQAAQIFTHHGNPSGCSKQAMLHHRNERNPKVLGSSSACVAMVPLVPVRPSSQEDKCLLSWNQTWLKSSVGFTWERCWRRKSSRGAWWEPTKHNGVIRADVNKLWSQNFTIKTPRNIQLCSHHHPFVKSPHLLRKPPKRKDFRSTIWMTEQYDDVSHDLHRLLVKSRLQHDFR